ncbi:MAG TPA: hypothetical protein VEG68_14425 [Terriglobales bacterium]|nr:hypothetical protein [Terriglobales bacterium]
MKRNPMSVVALASAKKMLLAIFCCAVLMLLSAPAWAVVEADPCAAPTIGTTALPVGTATGCGVLITITGTSGNLVATVTGGGTANGNPYDGSDDELVGVQNNTGTIVNGVLTGAVTIGAIRLNTPPTFAVPFFVTCTSEGQVCSPLFSAGVNVVSGPIIIMYTASPEHCSDVQAQIFVDGTPIYTSAFLGPGQSTPPIVTSPLAAGLHTVAIQATGEVEGCNEGQLYSWGGTLTVSGNITAPGGSTPLSGPFAFDGDGPCNYAQFSNYLYGEPESTADCFNDPQPTANPGDDPFDYQGPDNTFTGISPDYTTGTVSFITPIPPGGSTWFAQETTLVTVVSIGETQQLVTGVPNLFPFGPFACTSEGGCSQGSGIWTEQVNGDEFQFTPVSGVTGADYWTFLPVPVCAGPLGESPFGPFTGTPAFGFSTGDYGLEAPSNCLSYGPPDFFTNFPVAYPNANSLACVAYSDYSSLDDPVCVELERDCNGPDCTSQSLLWTLRMDYDLDANSIAGPIGGPAILFAPGVPGPTDPNGLAPFSQVGATDFSVNAITSYTGAVPGEDPPPAKGGGTDGKSVFVSAFSPAQSETNPIPPGVTVGFPGFEALFVGGFPVPAADTSNTTTPSCPPESAQYLLFPTGKQVTATAPVNCLFEVLGFRVPWVLLWDYTTTANVPITNLALCTSVTGGTCNTKGVSPPWVYLSLVPVSGCGAFTGQSPLSGVFTNLNNLKPPAPGQYSFIWEPVNNPKGCEVTPVLQFSNGTIVSPATFVYAY